MHVTVLLQDHDGHWRRGAVEGDRLAYPASSVKLGFLVGAVHWCREHDQAPDCLDEFVRPMIVDSDNVATGEVVDRISGAPNAPVADNDVEAWIEQRRYTERVLESAGLLGPQRLFTKTYPTNSGEEPAELERLAWQRLGRNAMTTDLASALMLNVALGTLEPQATDYMRSLLRRPAFSGHSSLGGGLPPGSVHENKIGNAFDTLQDVMYAELPNGQRLVIAAFTNGWDAQEPGPGDVAKLGDFTARLLRELTLDDAAGRAPRYVDASSAQRRRSSLAMARASAWTVPTRALVRRRRRQRSRSARYRRRAGPAPRTCVARPLHVGTTLDPARRRRARPRQGRAGVDDVSAREADRRPPARRALA